MKAKDIQKIEDLGLSKNTETYFLKNHFAVEDLIAIARIRCRCNYYVSCHTVTPDGKGHLISRERLIELVDRVKAIGLIREDLRDTVDLASKIDRFYQGLAENARMTRVLGDFTTKNNPYIRKPYSFKERARVLEASSVYNELYESYVPIKADDISALRGAIASRLTARDYYVLIVYYGLESEESPSLERASKKMHLSRSLIMQIIQRSIRNLSKDCAFPRFSELFGGEPESFEEIKAPETITGDTEIEYLNLTIRSYNVLKRNGYNVVRDIADCSNDKFLEIRNMNKKSVAEISGIMVDLGYESFKPLLESCS